MLTPLPIAVRDLGPRDAAAIVYLPGLGERGDVFDDLVAAAPLAAFRHLVLDYVDWTRSTPAGETIALEDVADRVAQEIAARAPRPVVLVGHSMGGAVAQLLAERHPGVVGKLVDVEGNLSRDDCKFSGRAVAFPLEAFAAGGFAEVRSALSTAADPRVRRYAEGLGACSPSTYHAYAEPLVHLSREETLAARLEALPMPVLYVHGGDPERGISSRSRALLRRSKVRVEAIEQAGHWAYLDAPEPFIRVLLDFIEG